METLNSSTEELCGETNKKKEKSVINTFVVMLTKAGLQISTHYCHG